MSATDSGLRIRTAGPGDADGITRVFLASRAEAMPYLPRLHSDEETHSWFAHVVLPGSTVWVAESDGDIVGFAAVADGELDHLYLHPDRLRRGIGTALLAEATRHSPEGLTLRVFQRNVAARAFYTRHGFVMTETNDGERNEENEPDMTYRWTPRPAR